MTSHATTIGSTQVVNLSRVRNLDGSPRLTYVGRELPPRFPHASPFANPFRASEHGTQAGPLFVQHFGNLLRRDPAFRVEAQALKGRILGCWCLGETGARCHAEVLALFAEGQLDEIKAAREVGWWLRVPSEQNPQGLLPLGGGR